VRCVSPASSCTTGTCLIPNMLGVGTFGLAMDAAMLCDIYHHSSLLADVLVCLRLLCVLMHLMTLSLQQPGTNLSHDAPWDVLLLVQTEYWNLGASSRRWIAPEHRHLAPPSPTAQSAAASAFTAGRAAATNMAPPPWATHTSTAAAAPWMSQAGTVAPPWATYTPQQPVRSPQASLGGVDDMLQRPGSSAGSIGGSRDSSSMRPHTAAGFEHGLSPSLRASGKPQVVSS
jgi:hypothetical protein